MKDNTNVRGGAVGEAFKQVAEVLEPLSSEERRRVLQAHTLLNAPVLSLRERILDALIVAGRSVSAREMIRSMPLVSSASIRSELSRLVAMGRIAKVYGGYAAKRGSR